MTVARAEKVAPVDGFQAVKPLAESGYWSLQITTTDSKDGIPSLNNEPLARALEHAFAQKYILYGAMELTNEGGFPSWRIKVTTSAGDELFADPGDWIVISDSAFKFYKGPDGVRAMPAYADYFPV